ncbi:hypothetical protein L211DRAFT_854477 [Terfezia boudieri ATCC MYA-4762]|uniref:Uncharacterized protein n=1 Tax=Terfezia boudieri ATCC MYA-4762 TaxID=1051890 RepID=A0A3N4L9D9_9PEZI|nr:hypothetical protein L211DRAFT_854477 [Terfezia boudieri ATCC MYA-4762]
MGSIPEPNVERGIAGYHPEEGLVLEYFMDDDYGAAEGFEEMFRLLMDWYFPRIAWAKLILKSMKMVFFTTTLELLGHELGRMGLRPSMDKVAKILDYPVPIDESELDKFLFMMTFLKRFMPGRVEHARIMKEEVKIEVVVKNSGNGKKKLTKRKVG